MPKTLITPPKWGKSLAGVYQSFSLMYNDNLLLSWLAPAHSDAANNPDNISFSRAPYVVTNPDERLFVANLLTCGWFVATRGGLPVLLEDDCWEQCCLFVRTGNGNGNECQPMSVANFLSQASSLTKYPISVERELTHFMQCWDGATTPERDTFLASVQADPALASAQAQDIVLLCFQCPADGLTPAYHHTQHDLATAFADAERVVNQYLDNARRNRQSAAPVDALFHSLEYIALRDGHCNTTIYGRSDLFRRPMRVLGAPYVRVGEGEHSALTSLLVRSDQKVPRFVLHGAGAAGLSDATHAVDPLVASERMCLDANVLGVSAKGQVLMLLFNRTLEDPVASALLRIPRLYIDSSVSFIMGMDGRALTGGVSAQFLQWLSDYNNVDNVLVYVPTGPLDPLANGSYDLDGYCDGRLFGSKGPLNATTRAIFKLPELQTMNEMFTTSRSRRDREKRHPWFHDQVTYGRACSLDLSSAPASRTVTLGASGNPDWVAFFCVESTDPRVHWYNGEIWDQQFNFVTTNLPDLIEETKKAALEEYNNRVTRAINEEWMLS